MERERGDRGVTPNRASKSRSLVMLPATEVAAPEMNGSRSGLKEEVEGRWHGVPGRHLSCLGGGSWFVLKFGVALVFGQQAAFGWRVGDAASFARAGSSHLGSLRLASMLQHGSEETL